MEIKVTRIFRGPLYTIGKLYLEGQYFCDTLEDTDRGLSADWPLYRLKAVKVANRTAIPTGRYRVVMSVQSPKFSKLPAYRFCNGYLPRLLDVPAYQGVLIHAGNTAGQTSGCILVGYNRIVAHVVDSLPTLKRLIARLKEVQEPIYITIE